MPRSRILYALLGSLPLSGCNCEDSLNKLNGAITVEPPMLDFGEEPIGSTKLLPLKIGNKGNFQLEVSGFEAGAPFLVPTSTVPTRAIGPSGTVEVQVGFRPTALDMASGQLTFVTTDPKVKMVTVPLVGVGIQAAVTVDPVALDFGEVLYNAMPMAKTLMVKISNTGSDKFDVTAIDLTSDGMGHVFTVDPMGAKTSYMRGASQSFAVSFLPKARGAVSGEIHIKTTAPNGADITVTLQAKGVGPVIALCAALDGQQEVCTNGGGHPRLSFKVDQGGMGTGKVRVLNTGDKDLTISQVLATGSGQHLMFSPGVPSSSSTVISPNQDSTWRAVFAPQDYTYESVILTFVSDSADRSGSSLVVEGRVRQPTIKVVPEIMTFTVNGAPGQMVPRTVDIYSCGDTPVILGTLSGPSSGPLYADMLPSGMSIAPQDCTNPATPAGATFTVHFVPPQDGTYSAEFQVPSNDPVKPTTTVMVSATKAP